MTDLNLLPIEYRKQPVIFRLLVFVLLIMLLFFFIIRFAILLPIQKQEQAYQQLILLKESTNDGFDFDEAVHLEQANIEELEHQIKYFQETKISTPGYWKTIYKTILNRLHYNTSINQFSCENYTIYISGTSINDEMTANYLRSLIESGLFSDVRILKILYQQDGRVHFTIQCNLNIYMN